MIQVDNESVRAQQRLLVLILVFLCYNSLIVKEYVIWLYKFILTEIGQFFMLQSKCVSYEYFSYSVCTLSYNGVSYNLGYFQAEDKFIVI